MASSNPSSSCTSHALLESLDEIAGGLELTLAGVARLRVILAPDNTDGSLGFDPKDPANKQLVGGLEKLTPRGVEVCYRLFDAGKKRYAVANLMEISFGAATHRQKAWEKAGGRNRVRNSLN